MFVSRSTISANEAKLVAFYFVISLKIKMF